MKISLRYCICLALWVLTSCSTKDIILEDFEGDDFRWWTIEGDAFGDAPAAGRLPRQQEVLGFDGERLANSYHEGDNRLGRLTSSPFRIRRDYINFLVGGGAHEELYIELLVEGERQRVSRPATSSETMIRMTWEVKEWKGKKAQIRIVDDKQGSWGHILVDQIEMSNQHKGTLLDHFTQTLLVEKRLLLLPIEENVPESQLYLECDGKAVTPRIDIRIAQQRIDYWIPIPVDQYLGKELTLLFQQVKKEAIGFSQIKQADRYTFDYNEKYRPVYHFSPLHGWTNDPNGLVWLDGEYHLFFQHNPYGAMWGNMTWGHAVSTDLLRWQYLPDAIAPDQQGMIYSGSAVIDKTNSAGFGKEAMVALYTSHGDEQQQFLAYSHDKGRTFRKYSSNPVLTNAASPDFRDPKVFHHAPTGHWVMVLSVGEAIAFYTSDNLIDWRETSTFGEAKGAGNTVWECPDLFPLSFDGETKWVLLVSNSGSSKSEPTIQYFIGEFDGKAFRADPLPYPLWLDWGCDQYAAASWNNSPDGRRLSVGWMNNWAYAGELPTTHFRGTMTVPRELSLKHNGKHLVVASQPVKEMQQLRSETVTFEPIRLNKQYVINRLMNKNSGAYELEMTIQPSGQQQIEFTLSNLHEEQLRVVFDSGARLLTVDRSRSGLTDFHAAFGSESIEAPLPRSEQYRVRLLMDASSSELFINEGEVVQTNLVFPSEPYNSLTFSSDHPATVTDIRVHGLK